MTLAYRVSSILVVSVISLLFATTLLHAQNQPTLSKLTPSSCHIGDTVTISGSKFDSTNKLNNRVSFNNEWYDYPNGIKFDSVNATIVAVTDTTIRAVVPLEVINGDISVFVNGVNAKSSYDVYYDVVPTFKEFSPLSAHVGDTITIIGTGFNAKYPPINNWILFNGGTMTSAISSTANQLKVVVPVNATSGPLSVFTSSPKVKSKTDFTVLPKMSYLEPNHGEVGSKFFIVGTGFNENDTLKYELKINGVLVKISAINSYEIGATVPLHTSSGQVTLTYNGKIVDGPTLYFTVDPSQPQINGYSIDKGTVGSIVKIFGTNFDQSGPPLEVSFGTAKANIIRYNSDTIEVKVPHGASSGAISVKAAGVSAYSYNLSFRVLELISAISPKHAKVGDTVRVKGTGFGGYFSDYYLISFPNKAFSRITATSDTTMWFVVPINATSGVATVFSSYNGSVSFDLPYFGLIPTITKVEPDTVYIGRPNQLLTILGTGFGKSAQTKRYDLTLSKGVTLKDVYVTYDYKIQVVAPEGITTGPVSLAIDSLSTTSLFNLVALPDTFPYKPIPPVIFSRVVTTNSITSAWSRSYRALGYILDISNDNFKTFVPGYHSVTTTDTMKSISGLSPGTAYQVGVRAFSKTDTSGFTYINVPTICKAPVAVNSIKLDNLDFEIRWFKTKGAENYEVEASIDNFTTVKTLTTIDTVAFVKISSPNQIPLFKFRVRAYNSSGYSEYSNIVIVPVTEISPVLEPTAVYPNPAQEYIFITGINEGVIESYLVDEIGRSRRVRLEKNSNQYSLDVRSLPEGTYILRITTTNGLATLKFIKL